MDPNPVDLFNRLLTARTAFEKSEYGDYGIPQYREAMQLVLAAPELRERADAVGAAALLTCAYDAFAVEQDAPASQRRSAAYEALFGPIDALFAPRRVTEAELEQRLDRFVRTATAAIEALHAPPPGTPADDHQVGIMTSSGGVDIAHRIAYREAWPQVALLSAQVEAIQPLVKALGRQVADLPWLETIKSRLEKIVSKAPGVVEWASWKTASKAINRALGVGMLPVLGHNIITFGTQVLAPWKALKEFPKMMAQQSVLYDLRGYAGKVLHLDDRNAVVNVLDGATSSIDWKAVTMAFKVTPVGILISVYSGARAVVKFKYPEKFTAYDWAKVLVDAADASLTAPTDSNRLAAMTVMHLAGDDKKFLEIMTCKLADAYEELAKRFID